MDSILTTIKKLLNIDEECADFDTDVIIHINSAIMRLTQLGVGKRGFRVLSDEQTWDQFLDNRDDLEGCKDYIYLKVKLIFDPPSNSFVVSEMRATMEELEWTLNHQAETEVSDG